MTHHARTATAALMATLEDEHGLRERARTLGVVKRQGKMDVYALLATVVLGVSMRGPMAIAQIGHLLSTVTGVVFARSSVWDRFNAPFRDLVRHVLDEHVLQRVDGDARVPATLGCFRDVIAVDATVVTLREPLRRWFRGSRSGAAAALKVHAWVRVFTGELVKYRLTREAYGDCRAFGVHEGVRGCLLLFDRAYSSPTLWRQIDSAGGHFLTRLPGDRSPLVTAEVRPANGRSRGLTGLHLREALAGLKRRAVDVTCEFRARRRGYAKKRARWEKHGFRVVALDDGRGGYDVFVTNAPESMIPATSIRETYRLRWEVETFFKTAKSGCALHECPTSKPHIVETLVYAALLRASTAMSSLSSYRARVADHLARTINPGQWTRWWNLQLHRLLEDIVGITDAVSDAELARMLSDPNVGRPTTRWAFRLELESW